MLVSVFTANEHVDMLFKAHIHNKKSYSIKRAYYKLLIEGHAESRAPKSLPISDVIADPPKLMESNMNDTS